MFWSIIFTAIITAALISPRFPAFASAQDDADAKPPALEGSMTRERINTIVTRLDPQVKQSRKGVWRFNIDSTPVMIVTDEKYNRMRILVAIKKASELTMTDLMRLSQANFDSALDARYAVAQDVLWAAYIHPLRALHDRQFISAIGQTVNIAKTYGRSYSSGALLYGGGDSKDILEQQLIKDLEKKGLDI